MSSKIQIKRGTTAQWASSSNDTTLAPGQPGVEYRTSGSPRLKVGLNTTSDWSEIPYVAPDSDVYRDSSIQFKSYNTSISCSTNTETSPSQALEFKVYGQGLTPKIEMNLTDGHATSLIYFLLDSFYTPQPTVSLGTSIFPWQTTYTKAVKGITNGLYWDNIHTPFLSRSSDGNYITLSNSSSFLLLNTSGGMIFRVSDAGRWILSPTGTSSTRLSPVGTAYLGQYSGTLSDEPTGYQAIGGGLQDIILTSNASLTFNVNSSSRPVMRELISVTSSNQTGGGFASAPMGTLSVGNYYLSELQLNAYRSISMDANDINLCGRLTLNSSSFSPTTNGGCDLGTASSGWDNLFMSDQSYIRSGSKYIAYDAGTDLYIGAHNLTAADFGQTHLIGKDIVRLYATDGDLAVSLDVSVPSFESFRPINNVDLSLDLGSASVANSRWGVVYCQSVSESSDVSLKSDIHYLDPPQVNLLSTADVQEEQLITVEDVLEFISELKPATFVYKSKNISTVADAEELDMEAIHLGIIANDIEDSKLFEYVASKHETTTTLEDGTTKVDKNLSIKPASLAVAALTACKYLINQVKELKEMLSNSNN